MAIVNALGQMLGAAVGVAVFGWLLGPAPRPAAVAMDL